MLASYQNQSTENLAVCSSTLFISNFPRSCTKDEIYSLMAKYGDILSVDIINKYDTPFAFIEYDDMRDAVDALTKLNGTIFKQRKLRVQYKSGKGLDYLGSYDQKKLPKIQKNNDDGKKTNDYRKKIMDQIKHNSNHQKNDSFQQQTKKKTQSSSTNLNKESEKYSQKSNSKKEIGYERSRQKYIEKDENLKSSKKSESEEEQITSKNQKIVENYEELSQKVQKLQKEIELLKSIVYGQNNQKETKL